jgi:Cu(I)/Ag(I) efflux system membrane protein CusA/SilA
MKRIAAPMVGGVVTSTILELIIYPAIYMLWKGREIRKVEAARSYGTESGSKLS